MRVSTLRFFFLFYKGLTEEKLRLLLPFLVFLPSNVLPGYACILFSVLYFTVFGRQKKCRIRSYVFFIDFIGFVMRFIFVTKVSYFRMNS